MTRHATRYRCRSCGNSAMFVRAATAVVHEVVLWTGREGGYAPLPEAAPHVHERLETDPALICWICGGTDLTYTWRTSGEKETDG